MIGEVTPEKPKSEKFIQMTTAPVERLVVRLAVPSIAIMLTSSVYNMADTFFVSYLGTSQIGAVGIAFPLMAIVQAMGFFFGQGSGNYMARALGAQDTESASRMAATSFVSGFLFTTFLALMGLIFIEPLINILGATETIKPHAREYIFYILLASPWMVSAMVLNQQLRFQGSAAIALVGMMSGAILNIFLDPIFIFALRLGVKGAAIATMISQLLSFFLLFFYGCTRKGNIPIKFSHFSPSGKRYLEMMRGGIPALFRQGLSSLAIIFINNFARPYGDAAIAAIAIVDRLCFFAYSLILGFGQGFQPVCGFNYGAKLYERLKKAFWFSTRICFIGLLLISLALAVFAPHIIALFRKDDLEVIAIGTLRLRLHCMGLPLMAIVIMYNMMTQTMGKTLEASITAFTRQGFFLVPALIILSSRLGLSGIHLATPIADIATFFVVIPLIIRVLRQLSFPETKQTRGEAVEKI